MVQKVALIFSVLALGVATFNFFHTPPHKPCDEVFAYLDNLGAIHDTKLLSWWYDECER